MGERSAETPNQSNNSQLCKKSMQQHMHKHMQQLEFGATHIQNARKSKKGFNAAGKGLLYEQLLCWNLISPLVAAGA